MADKKSSKAKVIGKLSEWEKNSRKASFEVSIQAKDIDGEVKKVFTCNHYGPMEADEKQPLPKEYTNKEEFIKYINDLFEKLESQI